MNEDVRRFWFSWILMQPMTLSGIRDLHWSYSRPSLIDIRSASLSTISSRSFILKTSDGQCSLLRRLKNGEYLKGQRLHLCFLTSITVTSPTPCPPNMAMLMTWPSCFLTSVGMRWKRSFLWICKELLITYLHGGSGWAQPKPHTLRSIWIIRNPAVSLQSMQ